MSANSYLTCYRDCLEKGTLERALQLESSFVVDLTDFDFLLDEVRCAVGRHVRLSVTNRDALASRLILGRRADQIRGFSSLWVGSGSSAKAVEAAASAVDRVLSGWGGGDLSPGSGAGFSTAHADFVEELDARAVEDWGPVGNAIRASWFFAGSRSANSLHTRLKQRTGFPLILGRDKATTGWQTRLTRSIWITCPRLGTARKGRTQVPAHHSELDGAWSELIRSIPNLDDVGRAESAATRSEPPESLVLTSQLLGCPDLRSGGLAFAVQRQADLQSRGIPAGVGFSGQWRNGFLKGVTGIAEKLQAAREAGVFLLFVCVSADEPTIDTGSCGVVLVRLPENLSLHEVIVCINTTCEQVGVTEYLWRAAIRRMTDYLGGNTRDRWLPKASSSPASCPRGFIGREIAIDKLDRIKRRADQTSGRSLYLLVAPPRSGKTTLLSWWISRSGGSWGRLPVWSSLLYDAPLSTRFNFNKWLSEQIDARYCVLMLPNTPYEPKRKLESIAAATESHIDVVVDGLDEVSETEQKGILEDLDRLPGNGLVLLSSQPTGLLSDLRYREKILNLDQTNEDAEGLIAAFAGLFSESGEEQLILASRRLNQPNWMRALVEKSGANLWILKEYLGAIRLGLVELPASVEEIPLCNVVSSYCERLLGEIKERFSRLSGAIDETRLETLLSHLSINEGDPWPLSEVLRFCFYPATPGIEAESAWRDALRTHARRVVDCRQLDGRWVVRYEDPWFARFVRAWVGTDTYAQIVSRLVDVLGRNTDAQLSTIRCYAVKRAARHVANDAPALAFRLVTQTDWVRLRFFSLAESNERRSTASTNLIDEIVSELTVLARLLSDERETDAVISLRDAIMTWAWAIELYPGLSHQWWQVLPAVRRLDVFYPEISREAVPPSKAPSLLIPIAGYPPFVHSLPPLNGLACELADRRLALVGSHGPFDEQLVIYDLVAGRAVTTIRLKVPTVRSISSFGSDQILLVTERDESGRASVLAVSLYDFAITRRDLFEEICGLIVLRGSERDPVAFLAIERDHLTGYMRIDGSLISIGDEQLVETRSWHCGENMDLSDPRLTVFAPWTWGQWSGSTECEPQLLRFDRASGEIHDIKPNALRRAAFASVIHCCVIPGERFVIVPEGPTVTEEECKEVSRYTRAADGSITSLERCRSNVIFEKEVLVLDAGGKLDTFRFRETYPHWRPVYRNIRLPGGMGLYNAGLPEGGKTKEECADKVAWEFFDSTPLGWLQHYGLILCDGHRHWSVDDKPESWPMRVPDEIIPVTDPVLNCITLSDGRMLMATELGAVLVNGEPKPKVIGRPLAEDRITEITIEGVVCDGSVLVNEREMEKWPNSNRHWYDWERYLLHGRGYRVDTPHLTRALDRETWCTQAGSLVELTLQSGSAKTPEARVRCWRSQTGEFEEVMTSSDICEALGIGQNATLWIEDAAEGLDCWVLLLRCENGRLLAKFDARGEHQWSCGLRELSCRGVLRIAKMYHNFVLLGCYRRDIVDWLGPLGTVAKWFLIDRGVLVRGTRSYFRVLPPLLYITADWCLTRGIVGTSRRWETFLYRAGSGATPVIVEDLRLGCRSFIAKTVPNTAGRSRVSIVSICRLRKGGWALFVHHLALDESSPALVETQRRSFVMLCDKESWDEVTCWAEIEPDCVAVGYSSRRCEVIEVPSNAGRSSKVVRAVGFTPETPNSMAVSRGQGGEHLVVAAGANLHWFPLHRDSSLPISHRHASGR